MSMKETIDVMLNDYGVFMASLGEPLDVVQLSRLRHTMTLVWLEAENHVLKQQVADLDKKVESGV